MQQEENDNNYSGPVLVTNTDGDTRIMHIEKVKTVWALRDIMKFIITIMIILLVLGIFTYLIAIDWALQEPGKIEWLIGTGTFLLGTLIDGPKVINAAVNSIAKNKRGLHTGTTPDHSQGSRPGTPAHD